MKFLKSSEKKKLLSQLEELYGVSKLDYILIETGKQKIRGFSGTMSKDELRELKEIANVEIIGAYLIKDEDKFGLRFSLDGCKILEKQISKNIIDINEKQVINWMNGENLLVEKEKGCFVVKCGEDFLGCGLSDGKKIINYVPKERRARRS